MKEMQLGDPNRVESCRNRESEVALGRKLVEY